MHKLTHSYSSIKMFDNCPKRYYHQRIKKEVVDVPGEASIYGERVHKSFEDRLASGVPLPEELSKHEPLCAKLEAVGGELTAEKEFVLTAELAPTTWWADDAWLRSKLDVYIKKGRKAVILDWKTGKRRPDFFQLELSAVQAFIHEPDLESVSTAFVWLKDEAQDSEIYRREQFQPLLSKLTGKIDRIEDAVVEDVWQAKPGPLCRFCPAKDICAFADLRGRR